MLTSLLLAASLLACAPHSPVQPTLGKETQESASSELLRSFGSDEVRQLLAQAARAQPKSSDALQERATCAALRQLVLRGFHGGPTGTPPITAAERTLALTTLSTLNTPMEIQCALKVLDGEGSRPNYIACDAQVRRAAFAALAREPQVGQPRLVQFAIEGEDPVRQRAFDALPSELSKQALEELIRHLASDREMHINRAASIASGYSNAAATLIPALVSAQYDAPTAKRGDEAWIAIGKTVSYVQNQIPLVGDASTSFQPVVGTLYEGSLLRIMESMVEIFRTEVHLSLDTMIEEATGVPPPPLGYDEDRWMGWYREEFPRLAAEHRAQRALELEIKQAVTLPAARDA